MTVASLDLTSNAEILKLLKLIVDTFESTKVFWIEKGFHAGLKIQFCTVHIISAVPFVVSLLCSQKQNN